MIPVPAAVAKNIRNAAWVNKLISLKTQTVVTVGKARKTSTVCK